jgi:hypothetical protein
MSGRAPGDERVESGDEQGRLGGRHMKPSVEPRKMSRLERAEWFFTFLVFFAGFFYLTRAAKTDLQWYFRVVSIFVGVAGWMVVQVLKRRR